jgi:integrase
MAHSANNARRALHSVAELLEGLHRRGLNLQSAAQADIDHWFAQPGATCWLARPFLTWARQRRHLNRQIQLPPTPAATQPATDDSARWEIARRLVNDNALAVDDRVAAALVVLYGQPLSRIVRLTTDHIHTGSNGTVTVNLDGRHMPIHEPFATLIRQLPLRRTHGPADQIASPWLFPGRHAGQPLGAVALGNRMRAIGVEARNMRNSARAQLVTQIPPAVLGQLIAINPSTASRWATITNSNWNAYVARGGRSPGVANSDV